MLDSLIGFLWRVLICTVLVIAGDALNIPRNGTTVAVGIFFVFLLFVDK